MQQVKAIIATTHVDKHGDVLILAALESMVEQMSAMALPVHVEHDPRDPPIGRIVGARVVPLDDGYHGVEAEMEIFEPQDELPTFQFSKDIPINTFPNEALQVVYDRSYTNGEDQTDIRELSEALGTEPQEYVKKALEPLSVLMIGGAGFVLGQIAAGFFGRLGEDGYAAFKQGLNRLFKRNTLRGKESLLQLSFTLEYQGTVFETQLILTKPDATDLEQVLAEGLAALDRIVPRLVTADANLSKLVFEYRKGGIVLRYGVRKDGYPMIWKSSIDDA